MAELKLGPLPKHESVRLSITLPKPLMEAMERYALDFSELYEKADVPTLVPHMLEAFLRSDKAFMKRHADSIREQAARIPLPLPAGVSRSSDAG